jgi:hypothetical protein
LLVFRWTRSYWPTVNTVGDKVEIAYDPAQPATAFVVGRIDPHMGLAVAYGIAFIISGALLVDRALR